MEGEKGVVTEFVDIPPVFDGKNSFVGSKFARFPKTSLKKLIPSQQSSQ